MADNKNKGTSLAKGPVALLGIAMLAWGILSLLFGGNPARSFSVSDVPSGPVNGGNFLGVEGNGWTNLLWIAGGALLLFGSPLHWGAKTMATLVGLVLGAASVISLVTHWRDAGDGAWGVFGIFAADNWTTLLWGAAATYLLISALLPRVGKDKHRDRDRDRDIDMTRTRPVERERVVEREPRVEREPSMTDARPANVVDREVVDRDDRDSINEPDRDGRFAREERITERTTGTSGGATSSRRDERL